MNTFSKKLDFLEWASLVYSAKEHLTNGLEIDSMRNREYFAEQGFEMTPAEYDEYADVIGKLIFVIDWFEGVSNE